MNFSTIHAMLLLCAKAMGLEPMPQESRRIKDCPALVIKDGPMWWNPLEDNEQAKNLADALHITPIVHENYVTIEGMPSIKIEFEGGTYRQQSAWRKAIVTAGCEIAQNA